MSFPSSKALQKVFRKQKLLRANPSRFFSVDPGKGYAILPLAKTFEITAISPSPER